MRARTRADAQEIAAREKMSQGAEVDDVYPDMPR
jgi:hypothetical protein